MKLAIASNTASMQTKAITIVLISLPIVYELRKQNIYLYI
jgi:hypothetical protein